MNNLYPVIVMCIGLVLLAIAEQVWEFWPRRLRKRRAESVDERIATSTDTEDRNQPSK